MASEVVVVESWHDALNAGDLNRLECLVSSDVEVGGPRGSDRGIELLREWAGRSGIRLEPLRVFRRDDTVVVEERAVWPLPATGEPGAPLLVATKFVVRDGVIQSIVRYDNLDTALRVAGLTMVDEIEEGV
jgi:hypothetical protein